jgi:hypothetical protein
MENAGSNNELKSMAAYICNTNSLSLETQYKQASLITAHKSFQIFPSNLGIKKACLQGFHYFATL